MSRLPSLAALRAFECVARHESFTKAADELCVTVPALSHHIKALELDLGERLFNRSHRSIELTDAGRTLFLSTKRAFASLRGTWHDLTATRSVFKVSTGQHFMTNWLAPRSARMQLAAGDVVIDHVTTFETLKFERGEVDLAIRNGNQTIEGLHSETIYEEWWTPMVAPQMAKTLRVPSDILNIPIIEARHAREPKGHPSLVDWLRANGVHEKPSDIRLVPHTETAMQLAAEGIGVKLCSSVLSGELHSLGKLVAPFRGAIRRKGIQYYMVCRLGEEGRKPISAIKSFFASEFAAMNKALGFDQMSLVELPETDPE